MKSKHFFSIGIAMLCLLVLDYSSAWTAPSGNPPSGNVAAPINTSNVGQSKTGALTVGGLGVVGDAELVDSSPTIKFADNTSGHSDWWIHVNGNIMYFINDRNDDGTWTGETPWPLLIHATQRYADFDGEIRADEYCNGDGTSCIDSDDLASSGGSQVTYFSDANDVVVLERIPDGTTWKNVSYPASIPATATGIILGSYLQSEDAKTISVLANSAAMAGPTTIAMVRAHNSSDNDSASAYTFATVPYSSNRVISLRFDNTGYDDALGSSYVSIVGYTQ